MKILYLVTDDWYFLSHRLDLARAVRDAGCEVVVCTRASEHRQRLLDEGFRHHPIRFRRSVLGQAANLPLLTRLTRLYREERPDLVHHVSFLPVFFGTLASRRAGVPAVVNAVTGLGHAFTDGSRSPLRWAVKRAYRSVLNRRNSLTIFQNEDDRRQLSASAHRHTCIAGSGVDIEGFRLREEPGGVPIVLHASRMLWSKGVQESVDASRLLRERGIDHRLVLAGRCHPDNPQSIPESTLKQWSASGAAEWVGHVSDVPELLASSTVFSFPTRYREGIPKILLEAAASGRAIVTANMPGCRDVINHDENGLMVPVRDARSLAEAVGALLQDPEKRKRLGAQARNDVVERFSKEIVQRQTLDGYAELLNEPAPWVTTPELPRLGDAGQRPGDLADQA